MPPPTPPRRRQQEAPVTLVLQGSLARFSALVGSSGSDFPPEQKTLVASLPANVILSAKSHPGPSKKKKTQPNHRAQCPLKGLVAGDVTVRAELPRLVAHPGITTLPTEA